MYNRRLGNAGENMACEILEIKGYMIIKRNYRCRSGEIDIIVRRGNEIGFVEVKSRLDAGCVRPAEAVDERKGYRPHAVRFHVVEIAAEHTENAF